MLFKKVIYFNFLLSESLILNCVLFYCIYFTFIVDVCELLKKLREN